MGKFTAASFTFSILASVMGFTSTASAQWNVEGTRKLNIMSYNVENLFDTIHDEGKDDWAYLPVSFKRGNPEAEAACRRIGNPRFRDECFNQDWNDEILAIKVQHVAALISDSFDKQGPDIIILSEVENLNALNALNSVLQYPFGALLEGPDERGIDVGVLSRVPLANATAHPINVGKNPTRHILEVNVSLDNGKTLTVLANHWPSQANPQAWRQQAARTLLQVAEEAAARGDAVLAAGDFNTLDNEYAGGVGEVLFNQASGSFFYDSVTGRAALGEAMGSTPFAQIPGSHWYQGHWSYLDRIFFYNKAVDSNFIQPNWGSFDTFAPPYALREYTYKGQTDLVPYRFDAKAGRGFSDHLPLTIQVNY